MVPEALQPNMAWPTFRQCPRGDQRPSAWRAPSAEHIPAQGLEPADAKYIAEIALAATRHATNNKPHMDCAKARLASVKTCLGGNNPGRACVSNCFAISAGVPAAVAWCPGAAHMPAFLRACSNSGIRPPTSRRGTTTRCCHARIDGRATTVGKSCCTGPLLQVGQTKRRRGNRGTLPRPRSKLWCWPTDALEMEYLVTWLAWCAPSPPPPPER